MKSKADSEIMEIQDLFNECKLKERRSLDVRSTTSDTTSNRISRVLKAGVLISSEDKKDHQHAQLVEAARNNDRRAVKKLLKATSVTLVNQHDARYGATVLYYACQRGHADVVALLLTKPGVDANVMNRPMIPLTLHGNKNKAVCPAPTITSLFVDDFRIPSKTYITPLHIACARGHLSVIALLLDHPETDVNMIANGMSAFHVAIRNGQRKVLELLLRSKRADINVNNGFGLPDTSGLSPLMYACESGADWAVEQLLKDPRVQAHSKNPSGLTAEEIALKNKELEIVKLFKTLRCSGETMV
jgi:ankyrin repeat protein